MKDKMEKQIEFFGNITAGITHEINNVLAVIKESSGLIEDIAAISAVASDGYRDKFSNSLSTIKGQLKRGAELTRNLNQFAHSTDHTHGNINLYDAVKQIISLSERHARLNHASLEMDSSANGNNSLHIDTNLNLLLLALFNAIEYSMAHIPQGGTVLILPQAVPEGKKVVFSVRGDALETNPLPDTLSRIADIMDCLNGSVATDSSSRTITLVFS